MSVGLGSAMGSSFTLAILWLRLVATDLTEALTFPTLRRNRFRAWLVVFLTVALFLTAPTLLYWVHGGQASYQYKDEPNGPVFFISECLDFINRYGGGISGFVISVLSMYAFYITIIQLRDFQRRISNFGDLVDRLLEVGKTASAHDKLHVISFTPAIGYLAERSKWPQIYKILVNTDFVENLDDDEIPSSSKTCMIAPSQVEIEDWQQRFIHRRRRAGGGKVSQMDIDKANKAASRVRKILKAQGQYTEVPFEALPGYYCFFTKHRAIITAPFFVPLELDGAGEDGAHGPSWLPAPQMIGFETTDRATIDQLFEQFDYVAGMRAKDPAAQSAQESLE